MHPPLYPFLTPERWKSYLRHALKFDGHKIEIADRLLERGVIPVIDGPELGHYLGTSPKIVSMMANHPAKFYNKFRISKRSGGTRIICAPRVFLKQTQRFLLDGILNAISFPECVVGFRRSMRMSETVVPHVGCNFLWTIDIKDFFPTINFDSIKKAYLRLGYEEHPAKFLAQLCSLNGALPQGAPTSPALANWVFVECDLAIQKLVQEYGINYTRYADDLSFSSKIPIEQKFRKSVVDLITQAGFKVNRNKERLIGPAARREVTGIVVNDRPGIVRSERRRIRAMFHKASHAPMQFIEKRNQLAGFLGWIAEFHPHEASYYREILKQIPVPQEK